MGKLTIRKFGPIKSVELNLNKINVIIGPQSSGKSCILKVASFCKWVEKRMELSQQIDECLDDEIVYRGLINFHKFDGYLKQGTFIEYKTQFLHFSISYENNEFSFFKVWRRQRWDYKRSKIIYIPAERNVVSVIPNWFDIKIDNNIKNYMADWEDAHKHFLKENNLDILDLGVSYFYDANKDKDKIQIDKKGSNIDFFNASSGLQSLVPLMVLFRYMTDNILDSDMPQSIAYDLERKKFERILREKLNKSKQHNIEQIRQNYSKTSFSEIFLEEPEENLFPQTQYQLVKWLVKQLRSRSDNHLFITTHSPYILSAFNNLIQAGEIINDKDKITKIEKILGKNTYVRYDEISVYAIENGKIKSIKDDEFKLISQSALDAVSDDIYREFGNLLELC